VLLWKTCSVSGAHDRDQNGLDDAHLGPSGFARALAVLVGKPVLWHISDPQSGVLLDLGDRVERPREIRNPSLTTEQRRYTGDSTVFITCPWWINAPDRLVPAPGELDKSAWWDLQLGAVVGQTIVRATTTANHSQLQLNFDNGAWLVADVAEASEYQHYTVSIGGEFWTVSADGQPSYKLS
jgi:hypothetical protein